MQSLSEEPVYLVLVGCGDLKEDERCRAKELYRSGYFSVKREYGEVVGYDWRIISAKPDNALLDPNEFVDPYDVNIKSLDDSGLEKLTNRIREQLQAWAASIREETSRELRLVALLGEAYLDRLRSKDTFTAEGIPPLYTPLQQPDLSGMGDQMNWMKREIRGEQPDQLTFDDL